jgi:hypothetical protein
MTEARVDEVLRRMIVPPSRERLEAVAARAIEQHAAEAAAPDPERRLRRRALALAAGLAAALAGTWLAWSALAPPGAPSGAYDAEWRSFETAFRDWTAPGFEPAWVCRDRAGFAETFRGTLHEGLALGDLSQGTEALGMIVCNSLSPRTTCVVARSAGQPVIVFVDRIERESAVIPPAGLNMFRREIGRLVLYEVSALPAPVLLNAFRLADP